MTPNDIEVLIHCHVSPTRHPRSDAPAVINALAVLEKYELIVRDEFGIYSTTTRGAAHIRQLCETQWPSLAWVDSQGRVIEA